MRRGQEKMFIRYPFGLGIRRSSDGLWQEGGDVLPWFKFTRKPDGFSLIVGEYAINYCKHSPDKTNPLTK